MTIGKFATAVIAVVGVAKADTYRSGSVSSYEKFTYGKFVTRMKAPNKMGTVSSFFTYWDGPDFTPAHWNELDVEIVPSVEQNPFSMNAIWGDGHDKSESHAYAHDFNPGDDWHTYTMEWTPRYISWSVDDKQLRVLKWEDNPALEYMNQEQSLRMNFWTPTFHSWGKGFDPADMPWFVLYDYVEVFTWDEENNEFDLHWRDDFDQFDAKRWHKASGTFDANSSVFHPENVSVKAGNLVLKMEPEKDDHHSVAHGSGHYDASHHTHAIDHREFGGPHHRSHHYSREHVRSHAPDKAFWVEHNAEDEVPNSKEKA